MEPPHERSGRAKPSVRRRIRRERGEWNRRGVRARSARLALELLDDGGDDVEDFLLLATRELLHFLEDAASLPGGRCPTSERSVSIEQVFDAHTERVGELGQDVGAGRFIGALPEGDVGLWLTDQASELGLAETGGFTKRDEASGL
jgi:hypothetical protein